MSPEVLKEISWRVRSGFYRRDDLVPIFCEEMYALGELVPEEVAATIDLEFQKLAIEQQSWPATTDCDRLEAAFLAISSHNIIALQNAGFTQSDGYEDFVQVLNKTPDKDAVLGYCFYHEQDLQRAMEAGGLYLAFGPVRPHDEATSGLEVGRIVEEELVEAGFSVEWNGTFSQRIYIPQIHWQRRSHLR